MVNVDTVYKTVLYILNKEQRGYIPPDEFNALGTQVQREIFEQYFEELNQQLRVPQTNSEYANRIKNLEEKIDVFKTYGTPTYVPSDFRWTLPAGLHRLGTLIYNEKEIQRVNRNEYFLINKSPLVAPTQSNPLYVLEGTGAPTDPPSLVYIYPDRGVNAITSGVDVYYIKAPINPVWGYTIDSTSGAYLFADPGVISPTPIPATGSVNFELHPSEQTNIILNILMYSGVVIRDPQIVQTAATMIQQDEAVEKQ
jgi:hypothetical protein